jgi:predicted RNase H-like nuclease
VRRALHAATFREALRINREAAGVGISKQAFHIMRKILEVDRLIRPEKQSHIYEVHPEVTFVQLNGRSLVHSKKEARGRLDRIRLLRHAGLRVTCSWIIRQRARLGTSSVFPDDLIDAMACLVTAFHIREGRSRCLGRIGQRDANNLAMEIYCSGGL